MIVFPSRLSALLLAGVCFTGCASQQPRYSNRMPVEPDMAQGGSMSPSAGGGVYKVGQPYQVAGIWYVPKEQPDYDESGMASWYGDEFNMKPTANGELFDMSAISAAHPTLPLPSLVDVTNLDNGKTLRVRVNDRGPFVGGRVIDLSHAAAQVLGYERQGIAHVRVRYVGPAPLGGVSGERMAANGAGQVDPPEISGSVGRASPPFYGNPVSVASAPLAPAAAARPLQMASVVGASSLYRVQAGAFSDAQNARRVASNLSQAGETVIEPVDREGVTLYRVLLNSSSDEADALALRDQVAALGYTEARVLRP